MIEIGKTYDCETSEGTVTIRVAQIKGNLVIGECGTRCLVKSLKDTGSDIDDAIGALEEALTFLRQPQTGLAKKTQLAHAKTLIKLALDLL